MASKLPEDVSVTVVLVAPALALLQRTEEDLSPPSPAVDFLQSYAVGPPMHYILRRIVGMQDFWKQGLKLAAWGDSELVTDSDALRFQWPSIGEGWEQGLFRYARAVSGLSNGEDLLHRAASRPNTRIVVILGEKDKVISRATVERVCGPYPDIPIVELEGCGHDPFEENVDGFVDLVKTLLL
jgi:pimeloyl-ACP methyl ester carboxylesterase